MEFWVGYAFGFVTPILGTLAVIGIGFYVGLQGWDMALMHLHVRKRWVFEPMMGVWLTCCLFCRWNWIARTRIGHNSCLTC